MTTPQDELFGVGILENGLDLVRTIPAATLRLPVAVDVIAENLLTAWAWSSVGLAWAAPDGTLLGIAAERQSLSIRSTLRFEVAGRVIGDLRVYASNPGLVSTVRVRDLSTARADLPPMTPNETIAAAGMKIAGGAALALVAYAVLKGRQR